MHGVRLPIERRRPTSSQKAILSFFALSTETFVAYVNLGLPQPSMGTRFHTYENIIVSINIGRGGLGGLLLRKTFPDCLHYSGATGERLLSVKKQTCRIKTAYRKWCAVFLRKGGRIQSYRFEFQTCFVLPVQLFRPGSRHLAAKARATSLQCSDTDFISRLIVTNVQLDNSRQGTFPLVCSRRRRTRPADLTLTNSHWKQTNRYGAR
jgi:hypothetical protein